jgi:hypothetical protein
LFRGWFHLSCTSHSRPIATVSTTRKERTHPTPTHKNNRPAIARRNVRKRSLVRSLVKSCISISTTASPKSTSPHSRVLVSNSMIAIESVGKNSRNKKVVDSGNVVLVDLVDGTKHRTHVVSSSSFGYASLIRSCWTATFLRLDFFGSRIFSEERNLSIKTSITNAINDSKRRYDAASTTKRNIGVAGNRTQNLLHSVILEEQC